MQWADASLLDFVEYLLEWSKSSPLFVLVLARPELLDKRPSWGAGHRNFTSLHLEPLSESAMDELLDGFVPGLPEELRPQILARAEGVPLYAVETVRMLLDRGLLVQEGAVYRPTGEIPSLDVPETLHGLVASRLDGLPAEERRLLQDAAVLGKTFTRQAARRAVGARRKRSSSRSSRRSRARRCSACRPTHARRSTASTASSRTSCATSPTRRSRSRSAAHATLPRPRTSRVRSRTKTRSPRSSPRTTSMPTRQLPTPTTRAEIKAKARRALVARASAQQSLGASRARAMRYFEQAAELTDDPLRTGGAASSSAGRMAWLDGRDRDARERLLEEAIALLRGPGGLTNAGRTRLGRARERSSVSRGTPTDEPSHGSRQRSESWKKNEPDEELATVGRPARQAFSSSADSSSVPHAPRAGARACGGARLSRRLFAQALTSKSLLFTTRNQPGGGAASSSSGALEHRARARSARRRRSRPSSTWPIVHASGATATTTRSSYLDEALELARRVGSNRSSGKTASSEATYPLAHVSDAGTRRSRASHEFRGPAPSIRCRPAQPCSPSCTAPGRRADAARQLLEHSTGLGDRRTIQTRLGCLTAESTVLASRGRPARSARPRGRTTLSASGERRPDVPRSQAGARRGARGSVRISGRPRRSTSSSPTIEAIRPGVRPPYLERSAALPREAERRRARASRPQPRASASSSSASGSRSRCSSTAS